MNWWENDPLASSTAVAEPPRSANWWENDPLAEPSSVALDAGSPAAAHTASGPEPATVFPWEQGEQSVGDAFVQGITESIPVRALGGAAMGAMESIGTAATWLGEAGAEVAGFLGIPGAKGLEKDYQRIRERIAAAGQRRQQNAEELNRRSPFGETATGLLVDAGTTIAEAGVAGMTGGSSVAIKLPWLGEVSAGLRNLAGYYASKSYFDSLQQNPDRTDLALAHGIIEGAATLIGGRAGAGTATLAGQQALKAVAERHALSAPLEVLRGAGVEAYEETATELAHYLTDVLGGKKFNGKDLAERLNRTAAVAGLAGAGSGAVRGIVDAIEGRQKDLPKVERAIQQVDDFVKTATPEQTEAAASATSRAAFTQATGLKKTTREQRIEFTEELQRRLADQQLQEQPSPEGTVVESESGPPLFEGTQDGPARTDNPAPATRPIEESIPKRQLQLLDNRVQKLRDAGEHDIEYLDELLSNDPKRLQEVFKEADRRADEHNAAMNEARTQWPDVFGSNAAAKTQKAKRSAAKGSDAEGTFRAFDQIVQQFRDNDNFAPAIRAEAERLGDGDLENGLFEVLQRGRSQFRNKTGNDFLADVLDESSAEDTSFNFGANELPIGDSSTFFSGIPLNLRVDLGDLGKQAARGVYSLKRWLRKKLTTRGLQNPQLKQLNDRRLGQIAKRLKEMKFLQDDLDAAVYGQTGQKRSITPELRRQLDAALKGENTNLPPELLAPIAKMRAQIDGLSRELQESGIAGDALQLSIDENMGMYVTRTYAKHSQRDWMARAKSDPQLMAEAKAALKQEFPADSDSDIEWRINMLLDKDSVDKKAVPEKFFKDAKFQSILMKRKDLPGWLRNLYGENHDPWLNHTLTVTKMSQLLAHEKMMADVRAAGLAGGWLMEVPQAELLPQRNPQQQQLLPTSTPKNPQNFRRIDGSESPLLKSLDGLYTDPDTHEALRDMFGPKTMNGIYRWATMASALAKWNVTVGNSKSYLRNFFGNPAFALANGDLFSGDMLQAARATMADVAGTKGQQMRNYLSRLAELNVIDGEISTAEIKAMMGDLAEAGDGVPLSTSGIGRIVGRNMRSASNLYQSMDTFWKINGFESKKKYYRELYPHASDAEIEQLAADDVRRHYTYYSEVPEGVRQVNRFPFLGNFLSFRSEVVRTTKNVLETARREIASDNPIERRMGRRRLVGLAASVAALPMVSVASKLMFGVSDEEDDDLRNFQAPWTRNSPYLYLSPLKDGKADVIDLGFADPRAQFVKAIYAAMGPGDAGEKALQTIGELADPLDEDILFGRVLSVLRNRTADGRDVYNEAAGAAEKARKIRDYLGEVLLPGTVGQIERVRKGLAGEISPGGREYDAATEVAGLIGIRAANVDVAQSFGFRSNDLRRSVRNAEAGIRQALTQRGTVDPDETSRVLADFHSQREKFILRWHELAMAAIRLGVDQQKVTRTVYSATGSKKLTTEIMAGRATPYLPSSDTRELSAAAPGGAQRLSLYFDIIGSGQQ